ncbi:MAG: VanZ family protein [Candidatus Altiarchaeota archaeon]|nr:VanZ family protein [Candidatus Altiarchaeota archaeon]
MNSFRFNPLVFLRSNPRLNIVAVLVWMALIFAFSSIEGKDISSSEFDLSILFHFTEYAVLGALVYTLVGRGSNPFLYALALCVLYAASDEFHQYFVPGRSSELADVGIDFLGSFFGVFLSRRWGGI